MNESNKPQIKEVMIPETGELLTTWVVQNPSNYTIMDNTKLKNKDNYNKGKAFYNKYNTLAGRFTFTMMNTLKDLITNETFTPAEKTRIMFLGTYVSYDKAQPYLTYSNGNPILKNQLQELLGMTNRKEFYTFYNKLVSEGVMVEDTVTRSKVKLIWSNEYHFKGKTTSGASASQNLVKTYSNQVRELYLEKNVNGKPVHTAQSLFNIFALIPYIHPESNSLCRYPEKPAHASEPFTLHDLTEIFQFTRTNDVKRMLLKLKLHNMPVVAITETIDGTNAFINPFLVNRTGKTPNASLITMFNASYNALAEKQKWSDSDKTSFLSHISNK